MGKTKSEIIDKKINNMIEYAYEQKLPFAGKLEETSKKYTIKQKVGLIEKFLIPAKDDMRNYLLVELDNAKIYNLAQKEVDMDFNAFVPTNEQIDRMVKDILYIIKVIEY